MVADLGSPETTLTPSTPYLTPHDPRQGSSTSYDVPRHLVQTQLGLRESTDDADKLINSNKERLELLTSRGRQSYRVESTSSFPIKGLLMQKRLLVVSEK